MSYRLPDHVRMCETVRGPVFLDLKRNRYTGLSLSAAAPLRALLESHVASAQPRPDDSVLPFAHQLLAAGLIETGAPSDWRYASAIVPAAALSFLQFTPPGARIPTHPVRFARAYLFARRALHRPLWDVLHDLKAHREHCAQSTLIEDVALLTRGFHRLRPYAFTARDQCLLHALALLHYLCACRVAATWMIGVHTHPWGAHSWVQWQEVVLDATPEQTLHFTPILAA